MTALTVPFVVIVVALTVPVYAYRLPRLPGLRLSLLRALIGGVVALACASPIITAIGSSVVKHKAPTCKAALCIGHILPQLWFVILGYAIALLVGMLVVVIAEALVPSGTTPGPLYLI